MSKTINKQSALDKYKTSYAYRTLLQKHKLTETGTWKVRGEDDNADFGGHHYMPELGMFEGKLEDIIAYAVTIPRFWTWGGGGDISKVGPPIKIDSESNAKRIAAQEKIAKLEAELKKAKQELEAL
jgi:hypothetical protein